MTKLQKQLRASTLWQRNKKLEQRALQLQADFQAEKLGRRTVRMRCRFIKLEFQELVSELESLGYRIEQGACREINHGGN